MTISDLLTKKAVVVKVSSDSQLRKLSPQVEEMIAMRLKGGTPTGNAGAQNSAGGAGQQESFRVEAVEIGVAGREMVQGTGVAHAMGRVPRRLRDLVRQAREDGGVMAAVHLIFNACPPCRSPICKGVTP